MPTYYSLQGMLPTLNRGLSEVPTGMPLDEAGDQVLDAVASLFAVLDADPAPPYVKIVTLA